MPVPPVGGFILETLFDVGPACATGMGIDAISEQELMAWQFNRAARLRPSDCAMIRNLSRAYVNAYHVAKDKDALAPWSPVPADAPERKAAVTKAFHGLAAMFPAKQPGA